MARVTLKEPCGKPKKFNKTVVLELTPMEAVIIQSLLANTCGFYPKGDIKQDLFESLQDSGVPYVDITFADGAPHFSSSFGDNLMKITEDTEIEL
jgi:hypothetical protein